LKLNSKINSLFKMIIKTNRLNLHNTAIAGGVVLLHIDLLVILPLFLLPLSILWALSIVPLLWIHTLHWGLIHEAIHKHLQPDNKMNDYTGRALGILMGVSFHVLRFGHLMHHKLNRKWQSELVEKNNISQKLKYFATLLGGLYIAEIFSSVTLTLLSRRAFVGLAAKGILTSYPEVLAAGERMFYHKNAVKLVRKDMFASALLYLGVIWLYQGFYMILLAFILSRALMISFMDNIYHYGTATDNSEAGKDLLLPPLLAKMVLNSNYHDTHHCNPQLAWFELPYVHKQQGRSFHGGFITHGLMQFNGPIQKEFKLNQQ